ncbi:unnamed protein product [Diatraea saccharalis]|uniref:Uncharacterized protein n=1 Tax=Diatraea saccharalis TaxID=40085 RepID=A0A9N9WD93_9NEOP|nr:unnamed protein product [Diatraea saccharalis]
MNEMKRLAWESFVTVRQNFLGNHQTGNYVNLIEEMLISFKDLCCNMSIKIDYLNSHLDQFQDN